MEALRKALVWILCLVTLAGGPLAGAQAAAPDHDEPCAMMAGHESGAPAMPCDGCGSDRSTLCSQQCAALYAGMMVPQPVETVSASATSERVVVAAEQSFSSQSGPPGLQPPR